MDTVSIEAFDRLSGALVSLYKEDAATIASLRAENARLEREGLAAIRAGEDARVRFIDLSAKVQGLLYLCDETEQKGSDSRLSSYEINIDVQDIRDALA